MATSTFKKRFAVRLIFYRTKTDTGGLVEYTKADERRKFKELGKKAGRKLCKMPCPDVSRGSTKDFQATV